MQYVSTVREVIGRGKATHPMLAGRMERAATIALFRRVEAQPEGIWLVESEQCDKTYQVFERQCDCPDWPKAPLGACKHVLAVALIISCDHHEQRQQSKLDNQAAAFGVALASIYAPTEGN